MPYFIPHRYWVKLCSKLVELFHYKMFALLTKRVFLILCKSIWKFSFSDISINQVVLALFHLTSCTCIRSESTSKKNKHQSKCIIWDLWLTVLSVHLLLPNCLRRRTRGGLPIYYPRLLHPLPEGAFL